MTTHSPYKMTISRLTVDKLGVKLYDRVSAVIAELVANSYDADAIEVTVAIPGGELLANKHGATITDRGFTITVTDNGCGMAPEEVNAFYLKVGAERRTDAQRGEISKKFNRKVMGRKGVGKLAPFGICSTIEVLTSGGKLVDGLDENGEESKGFQTAHLILERGQILKDTDDDYYPRVGSLDGKVRSSTGTTLTLKDFLNRRVPQIDDLERQLSQRFGLSAANWSVRLTDTTKKDGDADKHRQVGTFELEKMESTEVRFVNAASEKLGTPKGYQAIGPDGKELTDIGAGFTHESKDYPITGWVAYSKKPYKDALMAGVRIYCRGKIVQPKRLFLT